MYGVGLFYVCVVLAVGGPGLRSQLLCNSMFYMGMLL